MCMSSVYVLLFSDICGDGSDQQLCEWDYELVFFGKEGTTDCGHI